MDVDLREKPEEMFERLSTERAQELQKGSWRWLVVSLFHVRKRMTQLMILSAVYSRFTKPCVKLIHARWKIFQSDGQRENLSFEEPEQHQSFGNGNGTARSLHQQPE
jgi:hypothetical protein